MNRKAIPDSEMIINSDGSIFHLHLLPEHLADNIIVCGDPGRVNMIASYFDEQLYEVSSREFHTIGGMRHGKRIMALSHGIGGDNIDIVMTELDAPYVPVGTPVIASKALGFDGVLNYYALRNAVCDLDFERAFCDFVKWNPLFAKPYVVEADPWLVQKIGRDDMVRGYTISAVGFYGPQGREVRAQLAEPELNHRIEAFEYAGGHITNYEMESAALQGLGKILGHRCMTVCSIIANRVATEANPNYKTAVNDLVANVIERLLED